MHNKTMNYKQISRERRDAVLYVLAVGGWLLLWGTAVFEVVRHRSMDSFRGFTNWSLIVAIPVIILFTVLSRRERMKNQRIGKE
jgi:hypothetical protein